MLEMMIRRRITAPRVENGIYGEVGGNVIIVLSALVVQGMQQWLQLLLHAGQRQVPLISVRDQILDQA